MSEGLMIGSECAEWWQKRNKEYHAELEEYVLQNPDTFAIISCTAKATAFDLANVMIVDLARLGEGMAEGSVKGIIQDIFRAMAFIPPGKILQGSGKIFQTAKLIMGRIVNKVDFLTNLRYVKGGLCGPISIAQALQRSGQWIGVRLINIAEAIGKPLSQISHEGISIADIEKFLNNTGVIFSKYNPLPKGLLSKAPFEALKELVRQTDGQLIIPLIGKNGKHLTLLGKDLFVVKIFDRCKIFRSLEELNDLFNKGYSISTCHPYYMIKNVVIDFSPELIQKANQIGVLAFLLGRLNAVFDINYSKFSSIEMVNKDFEKFLINKKKKNVIKMPAIVLNAPIIVKVKGGDPNYSTLSGIARKQYGRMDLWPLIYNLNKDVIGKNPNKLIPGTRIAILPLGNYTSSEISNARKMAPSWRAYY